MVANPKQYIRASNGDGPAVRAYLSDDRAIGDMSVVVDTVLNWPTKFVATVGTINTDGSVTETCVFLGHLEGSIIMIDEFAPGYYDEGFSENQVAFIKPASVWADIVASAMEAPSLPAGGTAGQILTKVSSTDGDAEWEDAPESGSLSIIPKETPTGAIDSTNTVFTTANPYVGGSLQIYINGLAQSNFVTETNPSTGQFTLDTAPLTGDNVRVYYHFAPTVTNNADALDGYHLSGILDALFPVGSKYDSGSSPTLPALIASIGTWERFKGRVVVGVDESQTEFDAFGEQGGEKEHTLTKAEMPSYNLYTLYRYTSASGGGGTSNTMTTNTTPYPTSIPLGGGGEAHNNLQPYEATYMWKRIA